MSSRGTRRGDSGREGQPQNACPTATSDLICKETHGPHEAFLHKQWLLHAKKSGISERGRQHTQGL